MSQKTNLTRFRAKNSTHQESDDLFQVQKRSTPHCSCMNPASGQLYAICHDPPIQLWYFTFPTADATIIETSETSVSTLLNPRQKLLITASWSWTKKPLDHCCHSHFYLWIHLVVLLTAKWFKSFSTYSLRHNTFALTWNWMSGARHL